MKKQNYIADAWLVILLSLLFGGGLAGVQASLKPRIDANKLGDTLSQIPALVPGSTRGEKADAGEAVVYKALDAAGAATGWVIPASGQGFADRLELLIGLDATGGRITGLYVLDQKETPGLGDNITAKAWRDQYAGKATDKPIVVRKTKPEAPNEIQAITGATISSDSVTAIANAAVAKFRKDLAGGGIH